MHDVLIVVAGIGGLRLALEVEPINDEGPEGAMRRLPAAMLRFALEQPDASPAKRGAVA